MTYRDMKEVLLCLYLSASSSGFYNPDEMWCGANCTLMPGGHYSRYECSQERKPGLLSSIPKPGHSTEIPGLYENWRFLTLLTRGRHWKLFWSAGLISSTNIKGLKFPLQTFFLNSFFSSDSRTKLCYNSHFCAWAPCSKIFSEEKKIISSSLPQ